MLVNRQNAITHAAGPCEAMHTGASESMRANSTSSARGSPFTPLANASILLSGHNIWAHATVSAATRCRPDGPMLADRQNVMVHATGPCEDMRIRASKSLRANSTPSVRGSPLTPLAHAIILLGSHPAG